VDAFGGGPFFLANSLNMCPPLKLKMLCSTRVDAHVLDDKSQ
jgi:hypothetical protein